jgi:hypothetical protein
MAKHASENSPDDTDVQSAVQNIENNYAELASERGVYMQRCKRIKEDMAQNFDEAGNKGISKKLLKKIIKERELERRIYALGDDLEPDEVSEIEMLKDKLGEFANTPLGKAAMERAEGNAAHAGA